MLQPDRRDRQHRHPVAPDQERVLVRAVQGAAVLEHPQPSRGGLLADPVVKHDHAVRDVLLDAVAGQRPFATLAGDHGGHAALLEPAEQPPQLGAQDRGVLERAEQRLDGVEDNALGADLVDRGTEPDEQPAEVPGAGLLQVAGRELDVVHHQQVVVLELLQVEPEGRDVLDQLRDGLLERDEDARLVELGDAADQELHGKQRLAAAGRSADQGGSAGGQAAAGDLVEAADAGRGLAQARQHTQRTRRGRGRPGVRDLKGHEVTSSHQGGGTGATRFRQ